MVSSLEKSLFKLIVFFAISYQVSHAYAQAGAISCLAQPINYVRVAIIQDTNSTSLKIRGTYQILDSSGKQILFEGRNLKTTVTTYKDGILIGGEIFSQEKIFVKTKNGESIVINGRRFKGEIQFIKKENLNLSVINYIYLEDYIKGILYHEVSHYWPDEALKAQAIVCRTYALYQMQENKNKDYDVTSDVYSQVYGGQTSERYRTTKAVEQTKGLILIYQGKILPTYFHATCAGHTEDASRLWNIDLEPLKGVACLFCKDSPHFRWNYVLAQDKVREKLADAGYNIEKIEDLRITDRDSSGRITTLKIINGKEELEISAKNFREIIGPNIIRSTNFNVTVMDGDIIFQGLGWGHGVGLCQWGAYFMAKQGYKYEEILKHYYPGAKISLNAE